MYLFFSRGCSFTVADLGGAGGGRTGYTPLQTAVDGGYPELDKTLAEEDRWDVLSSIRNRLDVLNAMPDGGLDINTRRSGDKSTPLMVATQESNIEGIRFLLKKNCEINRVILLDLTP